jgi:hypothetical protein
MRARRDPIAPYGLRTARGVVKLVREFRTKSKTYEPRVSTIESLSRFVVPRQYGRVRQDACKAGCLMQPFLHKWRLFTNLGLVCATILFCLISAEWGLRLGRNLYPSFYPVKMGWVGQFQNRPSMTFVTDPETGWRMRPNNSFAWDIGKEEQTYRSNSQGFRSSSDFDKDDQRAKFAFVGDSFTFGTGVANNETFPALLETASHGRVSWNFGMPGFGVDQVWLSARHQALPLKPDLLVVSLVNADFERSQVPYRRLEGFAKPTFNLVAGRLTERIAERPPNALMGYLDEYSRLWAMWQRALRWVGLHYGAGEYWTLNQAIIEALREDCRQASVPVLFVYIPIKGLQPFPALQTYMRRTGAEYIDLTEQRPIPPTSIYLKYDSHLSAEGHRYVADLIENWLKAHPPLTVRAHP